MKSGSVVIPVKRPVGHRCGKFRSVMNVPNREKKQSVRVAPAKP
jgi:hypothetical protein